MAALRQLNPGTLYPLGTRVTLAMWLALVLLLWVWLVLLPLLRVNLSLGAATMLLPLMV